MQDPFGSSPGTRRGRLMLACPRIPAEEAADGGEWGPRMEQGEWPVKLGECLEET